MTYPFDLGSYSRKVSTRIKAAQTWFNRGLAMCYGYNHDEAVRCFKAAVKADPEVRHGAVGHRLCGGA